MLFRHDEAFILSIIGFGQDAILSDWYPIETGYDDFIDKIHIVNTSIHSVREYYDSLVYCSAREYYIHPISKEMAMYSMFPIDYFSKNDYGYFDREEIQQMIRDALNLFVYQYGSDYVEQEHKSLDDDQDLSVSSELDLILLDMDDDDENDDNPFGEELDDDYDDEIELDEYEYGDLDPELFEDPTLLMKNVDVASLDGRTIMALIVGAIRADRFCEGALLGFFEDGSMAKWLSRLEEIDQETNL